jgi:dimethylargininase
MFTQAIVRTPGPNYADGLTRVDLGAPSFELTLRQHAAYCDALRAAGLALTVLPADPAHPDGTFVEDTAIVVHEGAILTRPGAPSRLGEVDAVAVALRRFHPDAASIVDPGTVDGGDICEAGRHVFIGISHRTNEEGARQLAAWLATHGYTASTVDIRAMDSILHLKSGIACLAGERLLLIPELAGHPAFAGYDRVLLDADEIYAANAVQVNDKVFVASGYPKFARNLRTLGYDLVELDMSEYAKLDGGLSCLSLRF